MALKNKALLSPRRHVRRGRSTSPSAGVSVDAGKRKKAVWKLSVGRDHQLLAPALPW